MRELFSNGWWKESQEHFKDLIELDLDKAFAYWMQLYSEALINWRLEICIKLAQEPYEFLIKFPLGESFFLNGTQAIILKEYDRALEMLIYLVDNALKHLTDESLNINQALLCIFIGRYYLYKDVSTELRNEKAIKYLDRAKRIAREDGRPYAALGSYYLEIGNQDEASKLFSLAIEKSPNQPDGYVGMGLLAEERGKLTEAKDWYSEVINIKVIQGNIVDSLSKLLAKGSGNLYIQVAQFLQKKKDLNQALDAVNLALNLIKIESINERTAYRVKGEILEEMGSKDEAAEIYHEAAKRFYWAKEHDTAKELFYKVKGINEKHSDNYWYLADNLRLLAFKPEFPTVNNDILQKSLDIWKAGYNLKKPKMGWPYLVRALISESMAIVEKDKKTCLWEAVANIECALTFNEKLTHWWATLMRIYLSLELEATALQTLYIKSRDSDEDIPFLDQQAIILSDLGEYESALEIIEKRLEKEKDTRAMAIKAYNKFYLEEYNTALEIFQDVIKQDPRIIPDKLWVHYYCAIIYRNFDLNQAALKIFNDLWKNYQDNEAEYMKYEVYDEFIDIAFYLDSLRDESIREDYNFLDFIIEMANKQLEKGGSKFHPNLFLGLVYIKKNNIEKGTEYLKTAVKEARHKRHIHYMNLLILELKKNLNEILEQQKIQYDEKIKKKTQYYYSRAKSKLDYIQNLSQEHLVKFNYLSLQEKDEENRINAAIKEIEKKIEEFKEEGKIGGYAWIGINLTLVRWYEMTGKWSQELLISLHNVYEELFKHSEMFPFAEQRLESTINIICDEASLRLEEEELKNALNLFEQLYYLLGLRDGESQDNIDILCRIGFTHFKMDENKQAIIKWTRAIEIYKKLMSLNNVNGDNNPGKFVGDLCLSLLKRVEDCWSLIEIIEKHISSLPSDNPHIIDFKEMITILIKFFSINFQLNKESASSNNMISVVTPIALEFGSILIPEDEKEWDFINEILPEMRNRIKEHMGIKIPGIRVRGNSDLSPNSYKILLNEIPIDSGEVFLDMGYTLESPDIIIPKIPWKGLKQVFDPITGLTGCWVPDKYLNDMRNVGIKIWKDPMFFITRHLESILYQNLDKYLGMQEVENLLYDWENVGDNRSLIEKILPDQKRIRFSRILRNLVKEKVPITNMKEILKSVENVNLIDDDINEIISKIRLQLREDLPGNGDAVVRVGPIEGFEKLLLEFMNYNLNMIPPASMTDILGIVRNATNQYKKNQVLVIKRSELRPLARAIVELEFPNLDVITIEELI